MSSESRVHQAAVKADEVAHKGSQLLQGKIPESETAIGHPIHPSTVHWPIAFLTTTFSLSTLTLLPSQYYPSSILPPMATIPALAHYTAVAGVVTALPALITGFGEGYELIRNQYLQKGTWRKVIDDAWNMRDEGGAKTYMTVKHASMNDAVVALAGVNWYYGYKYPGRALPRTNIILGALALPALFYSAALGGKLVYEYAVGVQRQGSGKEVKEKKSQ